MVKRPTLYELLAMLIGDGQKFKLDYLSHKYWDAKEVSVLLQGDSLADTEEASIQLIAYFQGNQVETLGWKKADIGWGGKGKKRNRECCVVEIIVREHWEQ